MCALLKYYVFFKKWWNVGLGLHLDGLRGYEYNNINFEDDVANQI